MTLPWESQQGLGFLDRQANLLCTMPHHNVDMVCRLLMPHLLSRHPGMALVATVLDT
jgi:hypothetical protein